MKVAAYCRVSGEEQARSGFSIPDQEDALRQWCADQGHELVEVVRDEGHSGAYLERPGLDRVRDLIEGGDVELVVAQDADRITRDPGHRLLLDEEFDKRNARLRALDDWGDESHEGQLLKFLKGWVSQGERLKIAERTRRGRRQKSKQGRLVVPSTLPYGFKLDEEREQYLVDEEQMRVVRHIFQQVADGASLYTLTRSLEDEGVTSPSGGVRWSRNTLRDFFRKDLYFPHTSEEVAALVSPEVARMLESERSYGVAWSSRHDWKVLGRERRSDGTYRDRREHTEKPREEWIAIPVPESGIPREIAERARRNVELRQRAAPKEGQRVWTLSGGLAFCAECGRTLTGSSVHNRARGRVYNYYICSRKAEEKTRSNCPNRNHRAADLEERVGDFAMSLIRDPDTLRAQVEQQVQSEKESKPWLRDVREAATARERLAKLDTKADAFRDQQAEGLLSMPALREKLDGLAEERQALEERIAEVKDSETRLAELEALPNLVEEFLQDLPELVDRTPVVREYGLAGHEAERALEEGPTLLTPESIQPKSEEEQEAERHQAEAERAARFKELYTRLGLRTGVHADGTLKITVGATDAKGVMPCSEPSSPSITSTRT